MELKHKRSLTINRHASTRSRPILMAQTVPMIAHADLGTVSDLLALIDTGYVSRERGTVLTPTLFDTESAWD
jgi:hypothetical protein